MLNNDNTNLELEKKAIESELAFEKAKQRRDEDASRLRICNLEWQLNKRYDELRQRGRPDTNSPKEEEPQAPTGCEWSYGETEQIHYYRLHGENDLPDLLGYVRIMPDGNLRAKIMKSDHEVSFKDVKEAKDFVEKEADAKSIVRYEDSIGILRWSPTPSGIGDDKQRWTCHEFQHAGSTFRYAGLVEQLEFRRYAAYPSPYIEGSPVMTFPNLEAAQEYTEMKWRETEFARLGVSDLLGGKYVVNSKGV